MANTQRISKQQCMQYGQRYVSIALVLSVLALLVGFVGGLHAPSDQGWSLLLFCIGAIGALLCVCVWTGFIVLGYLRATGDTAAHSAMHRARLRIGIQLSIAVLCAFGLSFLMIPLYYLLNGGSGHVHGAAPTDVSHAGSLPMVSAKYPAYVYVTKDVNLDVLPIRVVVPSKKITLKPGEKTSFTVKIINPLTTTAEYTLVTKLAPAQAAPFLHYRVSREHVSIPAGAETTVDVHMHLQPGMPIAARTTTLGFFVLGKRRNHDWQKMLKSWHVF
jgi:hypothetical protein